MDTPQLQYLIAKALHERQTMDEWASPGCLEHPEHDGQVYESCYEEFMAQAACALETYESVVGSPEWSTP